MLDDIVINEHRVRTGRKEGRTIPLEEEKKSRYEDENEKHISKGGKQYFYF